VLNTALAPNVPGLSWQVLVLLVSAVGLLGISRLVVGIGYLNSCRRRARPLMPTPAPVAELKRRLGLDVPFLLSGRLTAPLTFGWFRPAVLLPDSFRDLSADQQEGVACHELLHVRRRDWPAAFVEELVRAVVWFHPAVWLILPRISLSREQVVDADTVRLTGKRRQYLDALWTIVCSRHRFGAALAVPFLGRRDLVDRVAWLQKEITMSKTRIALTILVIALIVPAVGVVGANVFRSDVQPTLSMSASPAADAPEREKKQDSEEKLKTVSADDICEEITHPVVVEKINPTYPPEARAEKVMGSVIVETVITEDGIVDEIRILETPDERLSEAAVEAIKDWRFEPAQCDGEPVGVYYNLTVKFHLK
jgi:TonB family protein